MELTQDLNRAARGLLGWSMKEQGEAAGISIDTLRSFESGRTKRLSRAVEEKALVAFEANGIQFLRSGDVAGGNGVAVKTAD